MATFHRRSRLFLVGVGALALAAVALPAGVALAGGVPGAVTGLTSSTHPVESVWYSSNSPVFTWNPTAANGSAVAGYSIILDQNPATVPDAITDRQSLDFLARVASAVGSGPTEDRVADLDRDGKLDLIVENAGSNTISVLLGNGDGTLKPKVDYATGTQPWSMDVADVDGDGLADVVTADWAANTASVFLGNGDGTFRPRVAYGTGTNPECLRLGDANGDGPLDIVTSNAGANSVSILLGNGDGTFGAATHFTAGAHPTSIDTGDVDGDGRLDIVTANYDASSVSVLTGNGDGTFNANVDYSVGSGPETVAVTDVDRSGRPDIVTVNGPGGSASVLLNRGDGTFADKVDYPTGAMPYSLDVLDLNRDGDVDLVTANHNADTVSILYGNGDGTFVPKVDKATGNGPFWVALGDFNGDGYGDLAVTDYSAGTASLLTGTAFLGASSSGKADGVWYFHVLAVDAAGVPGPVTTRAVRIDTAAPSTTETGADSAWHSSAVTLTFTPTDATSGVADTQYSLDGGTTWTSGTSLVFGAPADHTGDGDHVVLYRSVDLAGNVEPAGSCEVRIATLSLKANGHGTLRKRCPVRVTWPAVDGAATYDVSVGDVSYGSTADLRLTVFLAPGYRATLPPVLVVARAADGASLAYGYTHVAKR